MSLIASKAPQYAWVDCFSSLHHRNSSLYVIMWVAFFAGMAYTTTVTIVVLVGVII
jgi:hypothetical protein